MAIGEKVFLSPINLTGNEIRGAVAQNLATDPSSPTAGRFYYNTALNAWVWHNGTTFIDSRNRNTHIGSQLASTVSDLASVVKAYRLDEFAAPTGALNMNGQRITNLPTPVAASDPATMGWTTGQIQAASVGIKGKDAVVAVATTNIATLSGLSTVVDGAALNVDGMRVLLPAQTTASQNGPWVVHAGPWTRPTGEGAAMELETGALWLVEQGAINGGTQWWLNSPVAGVAITPGTTSIGIVKFQVGQQFSQGNGADITNGVISAKIVAGGYLLLGAGGLDVDTAKIARRPFVTTVGDGVTANLPIVHNFGTKDVGYWVRDIATDAYVDVAATSTSTTTLTLNAATPPGTNSLRVGVFA